MGTSSSQRSPRTAEWDSVRELLASGGSPWDLAGAVARAIGPTLEQAVTAERACMALLRPGHAGHSVMADLARAAAQRAAAAEPASAGPDRALAAEYLAAVFEYLVARDIADLLGTASVPDAATMMAVTEAVAEEARREVLSAGLPAEASWPGAAAEVSARAQVIGVLLSVGLAALRRRGMSRV